MYVNKINDAVNLIVQQSPLYSMMLRSNVANYTDLARHLKPVIESMVGKEVKLNTIVKSISLLVPKENWELHFEYLRKSNLSLEYKYSEEIHAEKPLVTDDIILLYRTGDRWKSLKKDTMHGNLALIHIDMPEEAAKSPGLTLFVVQYLTMHGIGIEKIYRFDTEILLVAAQEAADLVIKHLSDLMFKSGKDYLS